MVIVNFGIVSLSLSFALLLFLIFLGYKLNIGNDIKCFVYSLILPFIFILFSILSIIIYLDYVRLIVYFATYIYLFMVILAVLYFYQSGINNLSQALSKFIFFSLVLLTIQHLVYYIFHFYIDVHKILTVFSSESRYFSTTFNNFGIIRPTGWTLEPSNMSAIVTFSSVLYYIINKKFDSVLIAGFLTSIFTLSFASIIINLLLIFLISIKKIPRSKFIFLIFPSIFMLSLLVYYRMTYAIDYDAIGMRMVMVDLIFSQDIYSLLFGNGFLALSSPVYFSGSYIYDYNIRESGFWFNMIFSVGLVPVIVIVLCIFLIVKDINVFLIVIVALSSKFDYFQPFFWFFILLLIGISLEKLHMFSLFDRRNSQGVGV